MADFFSTLFGGGAQEDAAAKNAAALAQYGGIANPALSTGYQTGVTNLNQAVGAYTPLANLGSQYNQAGNLLMGSLGAGGPQATAAAQNAFQTDPGYTGAVTAGTDAIRRQLAAAGMLNSGNTAEDVGTFVQNLQNQQYQNWQNRLAGIAGLGAQATGAAAQGQAAGYGALGNLGYQYGTDQGSIAGNIASGTMADNNMVAAGQAAGAKNLLGAGLSLATLGMGGNPFGGSLTGGGFGSSLIGQGIKGLGNMIGSAVIPSGALSGGYGS